MDTGGAGLYANDFAADLRTTVATVARLPFDVDRLVDLLVDFEHAVATNAADPDHTTFWLVVADRFALLGVIAARVVEMALRIIDTGQDLEAQVAIYTFCRRAAESVGIHTSRT